MFDSLQHGMIDIIQNESCNAIIDERDNRRAPHLAPEHGPFGDFEVVAQFEHAQ